MARFKSSKTGKILILAKHIDGGTGMFVEQLASLKRYTTIKIVALEKPRYRSLKLKGVPIEYFSNKQLNVHSYILSPAALLFIAREFLWLQKEADVYMPD